MFQAMVEVSGFSISQEGRVLVKGAIDKQLQRLVPEHKRVSEILDHQKGFLKGNKNIIDIIIIDPLYIHIVDAE
jgi:hypothetical protein